MEKIVEHPQWYTSVNGIECKDINGELNYNLGCAVKYIWRAGEKDDKVLDYKKAIQYLRFEAERMSNKLYFFYKNNQVNDILINKLFNSNMELYKKYIITCLIKANNSFRKKKYLKIIWEVIFSLSIEIGDIYEQNN
jgi:hypothetical protein